MAPEPPPDTAAGLRRPLRLVSRTGEYRSFPALGWRDAVQRRFEVPVLARLLRLPGAARLLEVGCGEGVALAALAAACRPRRLVGLELDADLAALARRRVPAAEIVTGDVRRLPFGDGSFDVVLDFGTCYHVAAAERALAEIERVLAPGALFVHETRAAQICSHPVRSLGRRLPWHAAPGLVPARHAGLWAARIRR